MMVFSIRDAKAETFGQLVLASNRGTAIRSLESFLKDPDSDPARFPDDFALFELGEFDERTGMLDAHPQPISVIGCRELADKLGG